MEFPPAKLVRWCLAGDIDRIVKSKTIWVCSSCQTCMTRCPFEINVPHIIDLLKEYAYKNKLTKEERATRLFHKIFLLNVERLGRVNETGLIAIWKGISGKWFSDLGLGAKMFKKGKLPLVSEKVKGQKEVKKLFKK